MLQYIELYRRNESSLSSNMANKNAKVQSTFFGTSSVYLTDGTTGIFIDAFLTRPPLSKLKANEDIAPDADLIRETLQRGNVTKLDAIFVAHSHFDHAMDSPEVIHQLGGKLFGSESTLNIGRGAKLSEEQLQIIHDGDEFVLGDFKVRIFEGEHSPGNLFPGYIDAPLKAPAKPSAYLDGGCYNFLITHPSGSILVLASANYIPGKFDGVSSDVLYLGIGAMGSKDEEFRQKYWKETAEIMKPRVIIPVHWDNFGEPLAKGLEPLPDFIDNVSESRKFLEKKQKEGGFVLKWQDAFETICPFVL
jgi:L-ascorbate metabolism protein UlaG (beta-lactamase superfamily)